MKNLPDLTPEQLQHIEFMNKIRNYFTEHDQLGTMRTCSLLDTWGHGFRYYVKCSLDREYIIYEKNAEIHNVGVYKEDFI